MVSVDNVDRAIEGSELCSTLTQSSRRVRPLGSSAMVSVPTRATITATANNALIRGDLVRRSLVARIDTRAERPDARRFDQDLLADTDAQRRELVAAAQTIVRAYCLAGETVDLSGFGSFEDWSDTVRAALVWLGLPDPVASVERLRGQDPTREALTAIAANWHRAFGGEPTPVATAVERAETDTGLHDALALVAMRRGALDARALGYWFRASNERRCGRFVVERHAGRAGAVAWAVAEIGGDGGDGGDVSATCAKKSIENAEKSPAPTRTSPPSPPSPPSGAICTRCAGEGCNWCER